MADSKEYFDAVCALGTSLVPGMKIKYKNESTFMALLGYFASIFCPTFMTNYTTTLWTTIYFPNRKHVEENYQSAADILCHEIVHAVDFSKNPIWFALSYSLPQILTLGVLGVFAAFWSLWALLCLLFLVFLVPFPSPGRTKWELRGYTMNLAVIFWRDGFVPGDTVEWLVNGPLTSTDYYKMGWNKDNARAKVLAQVEKIKSGTLLAESGSEAYCSVYDLFKKLGFTK